MTRAETRKVDTGIIQRGKTYRFTVYMGYDMNGKQIRKTCTYTPPAGLTQKKADKAAKEEYINFCNRCKGLYNLKENMRFSELVEEYFRLYAPNNLKQITIYNYQHRIERHLMDYFGNRKLRDIVPATITDFFSTYRFEANGKMQCLSPSNAKQLYIVLQSLSAFVVRQGYIKESPCRNIILPQDKGDEGEKKKHLDIDYIQEFLGLFEGYSPLNTIIKVFLYTGVRSGECLGLQWEDIDFQERKIHIRHTLSNTGGRYTLTSPKTKLSARALFMSDTLYDVLKKHRAEQRKLQLALGSDFKHPEMVFTSSTGHYKSRAVLHRSFKRRLKGTAFEDVNLHMLRHTNATMLLNNGTDIAIISKHLGHSNIGTTADIYADVLDASRKQTADTIEGILTEKTPNKHQNQKSG